MATPNLTTEVTAVPQFPIEDDAAYSVTAIYFEDDLSQAFRSTTTKHRTIILKYDNQRNTEKTSFEAFFDARLGPYETFYWNNGRTGEVDIKVRFVEPKVVYTATSPSTWSWQVTLRKVT